MPAPSKPPAVPTPHPTDSKPFCLVADTPPPHAPLDGILQGQLGGSVEDHSRYIPARWHPVRRQLAYLERAIFCLRRRKQVRAFLCIQQFIALYAGYLAAVLHLSLPPVFLQPMIYVPRRGLFGRLWRHLFATALGHPALHIAFCHSQSEIEFYRQLFPAAAGKFQPLRFTIEPLAPPATPAHPPYFFSAGTSCRDYATLLEAARRLPPEAPPLHLACKAADIQGLSMPPNVHPRHDLWGPPYREHLARSALVIVPLAPLPVSAGQLVFLQAMSAGRPIIATRTPTSSEFLDDSCAWLVPPGDPQALAAAIADAWTHPEIARQKAAAARDRFLARHSPDAIARECANAIAAVLPG
jgi:glycosyltransferase involved in cell wall biosynthesis